MFAMRWENLCPCGWHDDLEVAFSEVAEPNAGHTRAVRQTRLGYFVQTAHRGARHRGG